MPRALRDDSVVVGCHVDSRAIDGLGNLLVAAAQHRLATEVSEGFAGETSGRIAGRNNNDHKLPTAYRESQRSKE